MLECPALADLEASVKRFALFALAAVAGAPLFVHLSSARPVTAQQPAAAPPAPGTVTVPEIPFDSNPNFLKYSADMNLGEVLGITISSKGQIMVLNHPGSATSGSSDPPTLMVARSTLSTELLPAPPRM